MMVKKRKTPLRHTVSSYKRKNVTYVTTHRRGGGSKPKTKPKTAYIGRAYKVPVYKKGEPMKRAYIGKAYKPPIKYHPRR